MDEVVRRGERPLEGVAHKLGRAAEVEDEEVVRVDERRGAIREGFCELLCVRVQKLRWVHGASFRIV